jgi:hemerythrin-like domain-containing protein
MKEEHVRINSLLEKVTLEITDYEKTKANFSKFKWNLEKHLFTEERAIFSMFSSVSGAETNDIFHLLSDHSKIMNLVKHLDKQLRNKIQPRLNPLQNLISSHERFEDSHFYPKLEEDLTSSQKQEIISRISEVLV